MSGKYDDILYLFHHVSPTHRRMTIAERAAQFSPFAALAGYEDAVRETGRVVEQRIDLSEEEKAILDRKQQVILAALERGERPKVTVTYFQPDAKKDGGTYIDFTGEMKRVKTAENRFVFMNDMEISFSDIFDLRCELFSHLL